MTKKKNIEGVPICLDFNFLASPLQISIWKSAIYLNASVAPMVRACTVNSKRKLHWPIFNVFPGCQVFNIFSKIHDKSDLFIFLHCIFNRIFNVVMLIFIGYVISIICKIHRLLASIIDPGPRHVTNCLFKTAIFADGCYVCHCLLICCEIKISSIDTAVFLSKTQSQN